MNDLNNFTDRLLDASLKDYSRVSVPEGFRARPAEPRRRTWLWIPAIAAAALAGGIVMMPMPALPSAPPAVSAKFEVPAPQKRHTGRSGDLPHLPHPRALTAAELARVTLPAEFLTPYQEKPLTDLSVPEPIVKPLESANPDTNSKE